MRVSFNTYPRGFWPPRAAFSLVEVTLALGIVSFCLIAILGLLPVGLKSLKNTEEEGGAANAISQIAASLRGGTTTNSANFVVKFGETQEGYLIGGGEVGYDLRGLALSGQTTGSPVEQRLVAHVIVYPPATLMAPGRALISVAWPAAANPTWNSATTNWTRAEGSMTTSIQFLPRK